MIDPRDVIAGASIAAHIQRAEAYFQAVEEPERLLDKPLVSLAEAPLLLYRLGLLLGGLKVAPTLRVLDFGAGTCWVAHILATLRCSVTCVDASETALALGRRLFETRPPPDDVAAPEFLLFDGETLPVASESIDRIICFDALHHVPNPDRILSEFHRVLRDGGRAGCSEPGRLHSRSPVSQYEMLHYGVIENDIRLEDIQAMADAAGFSAMLAAAESGFDTWLDVRDAQQVWDAGTLPEAWTTANRHSFHGRSTFVLQKGEYRPDSRLIEGLAGRLEIAQERFEVRAGEPLLLDVGVHNTGAARWLASNTPDIGVVKLAAKVRRTDAPDARPEVHRVTFSHDVESGDALVVPMGLRLAQVGDYDVTLDLLDEQVVWFETLGLTPPLVRVEVLPRPDAAADDEPGRLRLPYACRLERLSPAVLTGFGGAEPLGRWTVQEAVAVRLPGSVAGAFRVTLRCQAFGPNVGQPLTLRIGGREGAVVLEDHRERTYAIDFDAVTPATCLTLAIPTPASPRDLGVGDDDRRLGIALAELRIDRIHL